MYKQHTDLVKRIIKIANDIFPYNNKNKYYKNIWKGVYYRIIKENNELVVENIDDEKINKYINDKLLSLILNIVEKKFPSLSEVRKFDICSGIFYTIGKRFITFNDNEIIDLLKTNYDLIFELTRPYSKNQEFSNTSKKSNYSTDDIDNDDYINNDSEDIIYTKILKDEKADDYYEESAEETTANKKESLSIEKNKNDLLVFIKQSNLSFLEAEILLKHLDENYKSLLVENFSNSGKSRIFREAFYKLKNFNKL
jgi:hypothetical protein